MSEWTTGAHVAPMFWWWPEGDKSRVLMLDQFALVQSDLLNPVEVREIEQARRTGALLDVSFGTSPLVVPLEQISRIDYIPSLRRVVFALADDRTLCRIEVPDGHEGVASGLFEITRARLATGVETVRTDQERVRRTKERSTSDLRLMAALGAFGLLSLALKINADQSVVQGNYVDGITESVNNLFGRLGYVPAALALAGVVALQILRLVNGRPTFDVVVKGPPTWAVSVPHPYLRPKPAPPKLAYVEPEGLVATPFPAAADGARRPPLSGLMLSVASDPAEGLSATAQQQTSF